MDKTEKQNSENSNEELNPETNNVADSNIQNEQNNPLKADIKKSNQRTLIKLIVFVIGFFGFAYALIPLYDTFCQVLGIGEGLADKPAAIEENETKTKTKTAKVDFGEKFATLPLEEQQEALNRDIRILFSKVVMDGLPWEVEVPQNEMVVKPGKTHTVIYKARNPTVRKITGQAIPSYSPSGVVSYFQKIECFCFNMQTLNPGEVKDMAVTFTVLPDLPKDIEIITLHYRFISM